MIYIHIPFCKTFCKYCDFYSVRDKNSVSRYIDALLHEMDMRKGFLYDAAKNSVPTLYIGGGTPSLLSIKELSGILEHLYKKIGETPIEEFTLEVNPDDIDSDYALGLKSLGIDRISMGIQSFNDEHLRWMNRRHNAEGAVKAFGNLRNAGFKNISIDLIFGYDPFSDGNVGSDPEYLMRSWEEDLDKALSLKPEHISSYQMGIEEGSGLGRLVSRGGYIEPDDEICAEQYALLQDKTASAGYIQYEISNFSIKDHRSRHNSAYWDRLPYIGLGPGAHSFKYNRRSWNNPDLEKYISHYLYGGESCQDFEILGNKEVYEEQIMLGLRKTEGMKLSDINGLDMNIVHKLKKEGLLILEDGKARIPAGKLFISDSVIREFL